MSLLRVGLIVALFAAETVYFAFRCGAGVARLAGEHAYFAADFVEGWNAYDRAARLGFDPVQVTADRAELLLFGLDQQSLGVKVTMPVLPDGAIDSVRDLVASLLATEPYRAYFWSLASDVRMHEALAERRSKPLDLSTLSEDPAENLLPAEGISVAALKEAARREPTNYVYEDLLAEQFVQWGLLDMAAPHVRRAVGLYPVLQGHIYLSRPRLDPVTIAAAIAGFEDGLGLATMIPDDAIECDLGNFLASQGRHEEAIAHLRRALELNPGNLDALYRHGQSSYLAGDYQTAADMLTRAGEGLPDTPYLWFYLGQARMKIGQRDAAIVAFRRAREADPHEVSFFHALAEALEGGGALKDAERQYQAAATLNPVNTAAWQALLGFYERHAEFSQSARQVCTRLGRSKIPEVLYRGRCDALARQAR